MAITESPKVVTKRATVNTVHLYKRCSRDASGRLCIERDVGLQRRGTKRKRWVERINGELSNEVLRRIVTVRKNVKGSQRLLDILKGIAQKIENDASDETYLLPPGWKHKSPGYGGSFLDENRNVRVTLFEKLAPYDSEYIANVCSPRYRKIPRLSEGERKQKALAGEYHSAMKNVWAWWGMRFERSYAVESANNWIKKAQEIHSKLSPATKKQHSIPNASPSLFVDNSTRRNYYSFF